MTLKDITFKEHRALEFKDPITNKSFKNKVYFTILSPLSKEAKSSLLQAQRKIFELMQDKENLVDGELKPEISELINKKYLISLIKDWKNITDDDGTPLDCNDDNKELFIENSLVVDFLGKSSMNLGNFKA